MITATHANKHGIDFRRLFFWHNIKVDPFLSDSWDHLHIPLRPLSSSKSWLSLMEKVNCFSAVQLISLELRSTCSINIVIFFCRTFSFWSTDDTSTDVDGSLVSLFSGSFKKLSSSLVGMSRFSLETDSTGLTVIADKRLETSLASKIHVKKDLNDN